MAVVFLAVDEAVFLEAVEEVFFAVEVLLAAEALPAVEVLLAAAVFFAADVFAVEEVFPVADVFPVDEDFPVEDALAVEEVLPVEDAGFLADGFLFGFLITVGWEEADVEAEDVPALSWPEEEPPPNRLVNRLPSPPEDAPSEEEDPPSRPEREPSRLPEPEESPPESRPPSRPDRPELPLFPLPPSKPWSRGAAAAKMLRMVVRLRPVSLETALAVAFSLLPPSSMGSASERTLVTSWEDAPLRWLISSVLPPASREVSSELISITRHLLV